MFFSYITDQESVLDIAATTKFGTDAGTKMVDELTPTIAPGVATFSAAVVKGLRHKRPFRVLGISSAAGTVNFQLAKSDGTVLADATNLPAGKSAALDLCVLPGEMLTFSSAGAARVSVRVKEESNPVVL